MKLPIGLLFKCQRDKSLKSICDILLIGTFLSVRNYVINIQKHKY